MQIGPLARDPAGSFSDLPARSGRAGRRGSERHSLTAAAKLHATLLVSLFYRVAPPPGHDKVDSNSIISIRHQQKLAPRKRLGESASAGAVRDLFRARSVWSARNQCLRKLTRGVPDHIRSDNGPEFVAKAVRDWISAVGAKTAYIEPESPWENGNGESFNAKLRDELLRS
jgi:hypothetical protein